MQASVIVCTYNRAGMLPAAFAALAAQRVAPALEWELVVVDNNSSDDTRAVVEAFRARAPMPVSYVFEARQGLSFARNTGVAAAKGDVIAFTDDDTIPAPDWVAGTVAGLNEFKAQVTGGRILLDWPAPVPAWLARQPGLFGSLSQMDYDRTERLVEERGHPQIWGGNMSFRREVFDRIGLFDTRLGRVAQRLYSGEDVDFVRRALAAGLIVVFDARLVVWHRVPLERMRRRYFLRWHFQGGEGETFFGPEPRGRRFLGTPLFRYRHALRAAGRWTVSAARRRADRMERALDLAHALGSVWGHWRRTYLTSGTKEPASNA
jgi:glucosyl-dolichyl phosphate glucuronosyltransferase